MKFIYFHKYNNTLWKRKEKKFIQGTISTCMKIAHVIKIHWISNKNKKLNIILMFFTMSHIA